MSINNQNPKPKKSTDERRIPRLRASGMFTACLLAATAAAAQGPNYSAASGSVDLPYSNAASTPADQPQLMIALTASDAPQTTAVLPAFLDTGSTGILATPNLFPNYAALKSTGTPGAQYYSSSKLLSVGTWINAAVTFYDASGKNELATTASVPVLVVEQSGKCPSYPGSGTECPCPPNTNPCPSLLPAPAKPSFYMGIGFGQEGDGMPQATPGKNPVLNLKTIAGKPVSPAFNAGYIVGSKVLTVGLTAANTQGFNWLQLTPSSLGNGSTEWNPALMSVQVNNLGSCSGTLLADTGVTNVYTTLPQGYYSKIPLAPGTEPNPNVFARGSSVTVNVSTQPNPIEYSFQVALVNNQEEPQVIPLFSAPNNTSCFINTGRDFFCQFEFLYDYKNGFVGLRPQSSNLCPNGAASSGN